MSCLDVSLIAAVHCDHLIALSEARNLRTHVGEC
jgi:hypothetical protein